MDNYARKTLLLRLDKLQKDKASLKIAYDRLIRMPKDSIAEGAQAVISEFLDNYESDISKIDEEINSVCDMIKMSYEENQGPAIQCRSDLWDLTYVEVAKFASKMHADYYVSAFTSTIDCSTEPLVIFAKSGENTRGYVYKIVVPALFFNQYSKEIHEVNEKVKTWKENLIEPEDGDGS